MFVTSTYRITELDYPYGCRSFSAAYVCKLYLLNNWFPLHLWMRHITCSLLFVRSINRITVTIITVYVCELYTENHRVTLNLW